MSLSPDELAQVQQDENHKRVAKEAQLLDDYRNVMNNESAVRVIRDILSYTNYRATPFDKHAGIMARRCGLMDVGNYITARMSQADTELYCQLMIYKQPDASEDSGSV